VVFKIVKSIKARTSANDSNSAHLSTAAHSPKPPEVVKFAFIINASKDGAKELQMQVEDFFIEQKLSTPAIYYTTPEDAGYSITQQAISEGADVLVACGGDGTVRHVAHAVANHRKESRYAHLQLAILPLGTANLFARNLEIPVDDFAQALQIVAYGRTEKADLAFVHTSDGRHPFVVISGVGFDAQMVNSTSKRAKQKIGFMAYFTAGAREIFNSKIKLQIAITRSGGDVAKVMIVDTKLRTFMVGNCGKIPGFQLIPEASYQDGLLDFVAIDTSVGVLGWSQIAFDVLLQNFGVTNKFSRKLGRIDHINGKSCEVTLEKPQEVQVDGDIVATERQLKFTVDKHALEVRV
jgi:diacylglycerol kinase family enzyme